MRVPQAWHKAAGLVHQWSSEKTVSNPHPTVHFVSWYLPFTTISAKLQEDVGLFFCEPQQLLSIFTDLEDENLGLIQKCQETEDAAEAVRARTGEAKAKLNELVANFEEDIARLQAQIAKVGSTLNIFETWRFIIFFDRFVNIEFQWCTMRLPFCT